MTTINGDDFLVIDVAHFRIPLDWDPDSNMFLAVAAPDGALGNFPALVKGDTGDTPVLSSVVLTALDPDDPTPASASWTDLGGGTYQLNVALHEGATGAAGTSTLDINAYGTPLPGKIIVVNDTNDAFEYATQRVGDLYVPASIENTGSGVSGKTLCTVSIPAQDFDWRPVVSGGCVVTGLGTNVRVDLIARLDNATSGDEVGRGFGLAGTAPPPITLWDCPPAGSSAEYGKVLAGNAAFVYLRVERQAGSSYFTTSNTNTRFGVRVQPLSTGEAEGS